VKQRANCQNDCIEDLFLTYEREGASNVVPEGKDTKNASDVVSDGKKETKADSNVVSDGTKETKISEKSLEDATKIRKITLHYFEKFFDYRKKLKGCSYNTFELTEDFLSMIQTCG